MTSVVEHLRAVPLFQGMTDRAIEAVAGPAEIEFAPGDHVTREGDPGEAFYVVVDGALEVTRGRTAVRRLGPGDFLGEISLIDGRPRTASAVAIGPVKALSIERPAFVELIDSFGAVRHGILMALTERIRTDADETVA